MSEPKESSTGPVIGTIIILAVIVLGGFYFWSQRADNTVMDEAMVDEVVTDITTQSQADDTASIEADLNATEVNNIDSELNVQ
ncbi:MAG: hypothetical protein ABIF06_00080 [bacterium]